MDSSPSFEAFLLLLLKEKYLAVKRGFFFFVLILIYLYIGQAVISKLQRSLRGEYEVRHKQGLFVPMSDIIHFRVQQYMVKK